MVAPSSALTLSSDDTRRMNAYWRTGCTRYTVPSQANVLHKPFAATDLKALLDKVEGQISAVAEGSFDVQP